MIRCFEKLKHAKRCVFKKKGSITVEAIFIVSTVILITSVLIYALLIIEQKAVLVKAASSAANIGIESWKQEALVGGEKGIALNQIYKNAFEMTKKHEITLDSNIKNEKDKRIRDIFECVKKELGRSILKPEKTTIEIDFINNIIDRELKVVVSQDIKAPFSFITRIFSPNDFIRLSGIGTSKLDEPDEYIRNIDLSIEYAKKVSNALSISEKLGALKDKIFGKR